MRNRFESLRRQLYQRLPYDKKARLEHFLRRVDLKFIGAVTAFLLFLLIFLRLY